MFQLLAIAFTVGCATTLGALPVLVSRELSRAHYDTMLGLGAGLMLAAATLGLLPEALVGVRVGGVVHAPLFALVLAGFCGGVALLFGMDRMIPHIHAGGHEAHLHDHAHGHAHDHAHGNDHAHDDRARHQGIMIVGAMALHRLPEGFAIGAAFGDTGAVPLGVMLAVAVGLQNAIEGAVMAAPLKRGGLGRARLIALVTATGMAVPIAAVIGFHVARHVAGALPFMLAVGAGALIYLACNEIIPESHSHGNERRATFGLLAGVVGIMVLKVLAGE
ncbi:MAG TPA: ZIP family metal transporter [Polyangia bacterium]|jgi:ZIP family zinc transporter